MTISLGFLSLNSLDLRRNLLDLFLKANTLIPIFRILLKIDDRADILLYDPLFTLFHNRILLYHFLDFLIQGILFYESGNHGLEREFFLVWD